MKSAYASSFSSPNIGTQAGLCNSPALLNAQNYVFNSPILDDKSRCWRQGYNRGHIQCSCIMSHEGTETGIKVTACRLSLAGAKEPTRSDGRRRRKGWSSSKFERVITSISNEESQRKPILNCISTKFSVSLFSVCLIRSLTQHAKRVAAGKPFEVYLVLPLVDYLDKAQDSMRNAWHSSRRFGYEPSKKSQRACWSPDAMIAPRAGRFAKGSLLKYNKFTLSNLSLNARTHHDGAAVLSRRMRERSERMEPTFVNLGCDGSSTNRSMTIRSDRSGLPSMFTFMNYKGTGPQPKR
ncbi:uncharacterized protein ARMOST_22130 [Armillaria ostoyae]|uniref:Uncharacterized protein n=1 Tax=Armillaria ostoyae TaxID=47428 RepID=A0A284SC10_ARMOS|nr:uncharacterized protein ARMOST_22130 [Armillaria ostoyae]